MRINQNPGGSKYLNILTNRRESIDLYQFFSLSGSDQIENLLPQFLNQSGYTVSANATPEVSKGLQFLLFEFKNRERLSGQRNLKVGYPIYLADTTFDFLAAPVFFWDADLESVSIKNDKWNLQNIHPSKPKLNAALLKVIQSAVDDAGLQKAIDSWNASKGSFSDVVQFVHSLEDLLGIDESARFGQKSFFELPGIDALSNLQQPGVFENAGSLNLLEEPFLILNEKLPEAGNLLDLKESESDFAEIHPFSLLSMTPSQESAYRLALQQQVFVLTGASGSGKSQVTTNLLINGLSNGQKFLVISNRVSALINLQAKLNTSLDIPLHFLLKHPERDRNLFMEMLKAKAQNEYVSPFDQGNWNYLLKKCLRTFKKLDNNYRAVTGKIFGTHNWSETVGLYLQNQRMEGKELLSSQLKSQDFEFTFDEYVHLEDRILHCQGLFGKVNTLDHPLQVLNARLFTSLPKSDSLKLLQTHLADFKEKFGKLHQAYITEIDRYKGDLIAHYDHVSSQLGHKLESVKNYKEDAESRYGEEFSGSSLGWQNLKALFSKKSKSIADQRRSFASHFQDLVIACQQFKAFESGLEQVSPKAPVGELEKALNQFEGTFKSWQIKIPGMVQDEMIRLNSRNFNSKLNHGQVLTSLESDMDQLLEELNQAEIFSRLFENKMLTLPKRLRFLEEIIDLINNAQLDLRDFDAFYDWNSVWLRLPENGKKVVKALVKTKAQNWVAAFESWYFYNRLNQSYTPDLPSNDDHLEEFVHDLEELQKLLPSQVRHFWENRQQQGLNLLKSSNKKLFQYFEGKKDPFFLLAGWQEVFQQSLDAITDFIPVIFCTPQVAFELKQLGQAPFDWVIFEEAGLLQQEEAQWASTLGKKILIVGDASPIDTEDEEVSILEHALDLAIPRYHLNNYFSSASKDLQRFNQAAFQATLSAQNLDGLQRQDKNSSPFRVEKINGRFDEKNWINEAEALQIIHLLNQIKQTPQRTYPKIGIACFTTEQRDHIAGLLLDIKQRNAPGSETIAQLERNGLGVFYIGNLIGEAFDHLFASIVFGTVTTGGKLTRHIEQLNTTQGLQMLYALTDTPRSGLTILHSLPNSFFDEWGNLQEKPGTFRLAQLLHYLKFLQEGKTTEAEEILAGVYHSEPAQYQDELPSHFAKAVIQEIQPRTRERKLELNASQGGFRVPVYTQNAEKKYFLQTDGFLARTPFSSFVWEYQARKSLEKDGYAFVPIWSTNWWKNPEEATKDLLSVIQEAAPENNHAPEEE